LLSDLVADRVFVSVLANGGGKIAVRAKVGAPESVFHLRVALEYLSP
jgi:hypothetical protein